MKLSDIKIAKKLYGMILITMIGVVAITLVAQHQMGEVYKSASYAHVNTVPSVMVMGDILTRFYGIRVDVRDHIIESELAKMQGWDKVIQEKTGAIEKSLQLYEDTLISNEEDRRLLQADRALFKDYIASIQPVLELSRQIKNKEALVSLKNAATISQRFDAALTLHMAFNKKLADENAQEALAAMETATWVSALAALIMLTLTSLLGWIIANRQLARPIGGVVESLLQLSNGKLDVVVSGTERQDEVGEIARAAKMLQEVYLKIDRERWVKEKLAEIAQALQTASTRVEFGDILCSHLAQNMGLAYGALFVANADKTQLKRFGGYGCDDTIHANHFAWGQSLVGQAAQSKSKILLAPAAGDRVGVSTGLGKLLINHVLIAPIVDRGNVLAVLELGTLQIFDNRQMLFLEALLPDIAEKIQILAGNVATRELLVQTQVQAEALAVSEQQLISRRTELEENNNKLAEQARSLEESAEELEQQKSSLLGQREELEASKEILAQTEERTRLILSAVSDGIVGMDAEGKITFCNPAVPALLGYPEEELIGQPMHALVHYAYPDGREFPRAECSMYLTTCDGQPRKVDSEVFWRKDGTVLPVAYVATAIYQGGRITGSVIVFRDITEQKQAEEERLHASSLPNVAKRR